jgi:hypothetical protein
LGDLLVRRAVVETNCSRLVPSIERMMIEQRCQQPSFDVLQWSESHSLLLIHARSIVSPKHSGDMTRACGRYVGLASIDPAMGSPGGQVSENAVFTTVIGKEHDRGCCEAVESQP